MCRGQEWLVKVSNLSYFCSGSCLFAFDFTYEDLINIDNVSGYCAGMCSMKMSDGPHLSLRFLRIFL
jgi:hypothetical protein